MQLTYVVSDPGKHRWGNGDLGQEWEGTPLRLAAEPDPLGALWEPSKNTHPRVFPPRDKGAGVCVHQLASASG